MSEQKPDGVDFALNAGLDAKLAGMSDAAYCLYIEQMRRPECLGWEAKVRAGQFGREHLAAFMHAAEMLGRHKALAEAAQMVRAAASNAELSGARREEK